MKILGLFLSKKTFADLVLVSVSLTWGVAFPLMHIAIKELGPYHFLLAKYLFSTLIFLPFFLFFAEHKKFFTYLPYGLILGILYFLASLFQAEGLNEIPAGRNAFITGLVVVFVPLFSPIFHKIYPKKVDIIAIMFVLFGMYLLLDPFKSSELAHGDILSLIGTLFFTLHLQTLQKFMKKFNEPIIFAFYQVFFIALFSSILIPSTQGKSSFLIFTYTPLYIWVILFTLGAIVMLAFFIQAKFQPKTTPTRAVLIYNLQPALAAFFSYYMLGERMSPQAIVGGAIVILAVVISKSYHFYNENHKAV